MAAPLSDIALMNDANLIAYYKLESTADSKGSFTLTNNNTVTFGAAKFGNGADGGSANTNKSLSYPSNLGITGGACAFSFWLKLNAEIGAGTWALFSHFSATNNVRFLIEYNYNGGTRTFRCVRVRAGVASDAFVVNQTLGTANWHHIVLTYNGTTLRCYVDNSDIGNVGSTGNGSGTGSIDKFSIMSEVDLGNFTSGLYDDFAVFNRNLTATDVSNIYNGVPITGQFFTMFD